MYRKVFQRFSKEKWYLKGGPRHKQKVSFQKKKTIFCLCRGPPFKKVFFCQPFFEKIQTFGFPNKNGIFEKIQGFPNKNGIFEKIQGFPKENLCPFLFYGTGAENLCPFLFFGTG